MTLQHMRYVLALAEYGSFNETAKKLFVSQPSLSNAIKELEKELDTMLFIRTKKGVELSPDGYEFLESAREIVGAADQLLTRFKERNTSPMRFSISTLHYGFVSQAFVRLISNLSGNYDVVCRESSYQQAIQDVVSYKSEIGILYINSTNNRYLPRQIRDNQLMFTSLYEAGTNIVIHKNHPLKDQLSVSLEDLISYPFITYEYEMSCGPNMFEVDFPFPGGRPEKMLRAQDRSTLNWLIRNTDGYSIGHGLMDDDFHKDLIHIPFNFASNSVTIGWICRKEQPLSELAQKFISLLQEEVELRLHQQKYGL